MERFKCVICEGIQNVVRICANNHLVCDKCFRDLPKDGNRCKKCWTTFGNIEMNPIRNKMRNSCENRVHGCPLMLTGDLRNMHEMECAYRKSFCLGAKLKIWNCKWSGLAHKIVQHLHVEHGNQMGRPFKAADDLRMKHDLTVFQSKVQWFCAYELMFFCFYVSEPKDQRLRIVFFVLADSEVAEQFFVKLQLCNSNDEYNYIKIETNISSDSLSYSKLISERRCITFTFQTLKNFQNADGFLSFRYIIKHKGTF